MVPGSMWCVPGDLELNQVLEWFVGGDLRGDLEPDAVVGETILTGLRPG